MQYRPDVLPSSNMTINPQFPIELLGAGSEPGDPELHFVQHPTFTATLVRHLYGTVPTKNKTKPRYSIVDARIRNVDES